MTVTAIDLLPHVVAVVSGLAALAASGHAILFKRDVRAATGWVVFIWFAPLAGPLLYLLLGVNRIKRRASAMRGAPSVAPPPGGDIVTAGELEERLGPANAHLGHLREVMERVMSRPMLRGNHVVPLVSGEEAYAEMLAAIDAAQHSLAFATYIFDNDEQGERFVDAFCRAARRGVEVRVLIDAVGARYSWPPILGRLRRHGVRGSYFLPTLVPWRVPYMNLRNHRKFLMADGRVAFTGGMNVRRGHVLEETHPDAIRDLHFKVEGPVVFHMMDVFVHDWAFASHEWLDGPAWFPQLDDRGGVLARAVADGPDEDFDKLRWSYLGALACAARRVRIVTPYFLPDNSLITALTMAARRGVEVDIVLPEKNNLRLVQWASTAQLWQVLEAGCRVWYSRPAFDHTKLLLVDEIWALIGSSNWDPRSFRLNFEFNLECVDSALTRLLDGVVEERLSRARPVSLGDVDARRLPVRLRDGAARLLAPYL